MYYQNELRKGVVLEWWSSKAVDCLIQVVYITGLTAFIPDEKNLTLSKFKAFEDENISVP